jgi:hypothetical protein
VLVTDIGDGYVCWWAQSSGTRVNISAIGDLWCDLLKDDTRHSQGVCRWGANIAGTRDGELGPVQRTVMVPWSSFVMMDQLELLLSYGRTRGWAYREPQGNHG